MGSFMDKVGGFVSDISGFDVTGVVPGLTGQLGAEASQQGAQLQYQSVLKGIEAQKEARESVQKNLQPYLNMGTATIPAYQNLLTPQGQQSYLKSNPMFNAAVQNASDQLKGVAASRGKLGSGGLVNQLFQNYLGQGDAFVNSQFNRLGQALNIGQNSAAMQGSNIQNSANNITSLLGQGGNALAAGGIGAANAYSQGAGNIMGLAGMAASFFSDERLKEDMTPIGKDAEGNTLYSWKYKVHNPMFVGYSAQEVAKKDPSNVMLDQSGYLKVTEKYKPVRVS